MASQKNFAEIYYNTIGRVNTKHWWEFIRRLGLPESDIDEIFYEDDDLTEQKYQMLLRWRHLYGYKKDPGDILRCLTQAENELSGASTDVLNQTLAGTLLQNRYISMKFYEVIRSIREEQRRKFAMTRLNLSDYEVSSISVDYRKDTDEQFFQMLLTWKRKSRHQHYQDLKPAIEKLLDDFLGMEQGTARQQAANQPAPRGQPTWDIVDEVSDQNPSQISPSDAFGV